VLKSYTIGDFFSNGLLNKDIEQKIYSKKIGQNDVISTNMFDFEVVSLDKNDEILKMATRFQYWDIWIIKAVKNGQSL
jgi:hypothetical protein